MPIQENLTQDILDSVGEGVFTVDKNFRITFFNRAAEKITGFFREEVVGKYCKYVCDSGSCAGSCPIAQVLQTGEKISNLESKMSRKNGERIHVKLNSSVLYNSANEPVGGVISFRDMTDIELIKGKLYQESQFYGIVAHSKVMHEIFELIEEIADSDASVLIQGESGTGKEMVANAIQAASPRCEMPFIKINCSIFPPQLLASELFGHVKGAFTGAIKDRLGRFELADNGTVFLDEVVEMPLETQMQLLRVLQEGTFERIGESITRHVDVRVIAATNQDIKSSLDKGQFRSDLYYRLNVIPIEIPPLRQRPDDIPALVRHFIYKFSLFYKKEIKEIEDEALDILLRYDWPGNVRELENAIEYAFVRTKNNDTIHFAKLPLKVRDMNGNNGRCNNVKNNQERKILDLLAYHRWNKSKVAEELGIGRTTLWRRLKAMGLEEN